MMPAIDVGFSAFIAQNGAFLASTAGNAVNDEGIDGYLPLPSN
jgi:hypothetical protein